ncbi:MAG: peptide MFS transporter [Candidatus Eisenbacteria bacterium]|nr:peptide MFS transporter [Candidatus Eisenbacteria bacterium]
MSNATLATAAPRDGGKWLGHPRGLFVLFLTEMWERMSYYGMRSLLALYMLNFLFVKPEVGREVLGFNFVSGVFQNLFHAAWTPQPLQSWIYGLYTGLVYLTPLFGGLMADKLIGRRKSVIIGGVIMAIGQFLLMAPNLFFPGLLMLILGNGCFKPNISTQVGALYAPGDRLRDSAFSIFYVGINVGAFLAPLVCGTLGQKVGWNWGFGSAGVGMVLGVIFYVMNQKLLPVEPPPTQSTTAPLIGLVGYLVGVPVGVLALLFLLTLPTWIPLTLAILAVVSAIGWIVRLPGDEKPRVIAIVVACVIVAAFWAVYEQQGNTMQVWADQNTHWPTIFGFTLPSTWYQAFNPFMIWFFTPALTWFWAQQAKKKQEPTSLTKMALGCILLGLGFLVMIAASNGMAPDARRSILWLAGSTAVFTLGELYLSPIGLSFVTKVSPARIVSMMMGVWFLANFIGNYMTGYLGTFYTKMPKTHFFLMLAGIGVAAGVVLFLMSRPMEKVVAAHDSHQA